jgi:hypothetical protein
MRESLCLAVVLAGLALAPAKAEQRLSLDEARTLGQTLIADNQPAAAREIALGLLQADGNDIGALILLSRAERALGNTAAALKAGRIAWGVSRDPAERFVVASVMAQAHASAENFTRAQLWLRRAAENAPNEQLAALAARDFGVLRQANPWTINLSFGAMPSDNVNNGNSNSTLTFAYLPGALANLAWEVPADDRPLSGVALTGQVQLSYRLAQTPQSQTTVGLTLFAQGYVLSDSARATAPDVTARSLGYQQATVNLSHNWATEGASGPFSTDLSLTESAYGGDPYTRDIALSFGRQWQLENAQVFSAALAGNHTTYHADGSTSKGASLRGAWQQTLGNADTFGMALNATQVSADRPDRGYSGIGVQLSYDFGEVMQGVELSVSGSLEQRVYDRSSYDPAGRTDIRSALQMNIGLPVAAFYGFEPVATLSANQTNSTVPYFETRSIRLGLQVKSSF